MHEIVAAMAITVATSTIRRSTRRCRSRRWLARPGPTMRSLARGLMEIVNDVRVVVWKLCARRVTLRNLFVSVLCSSPAHLGSTEVWRSPGASGAALERLADREARQRGGRQEPRWDAAADM